MKRRLTTTGGACALLALGALLAGPLQAASPHEILQSQCAACHALTPPESAPLERLWDRGGPDLHYAGVKFREAWLERWLIEPTRIRPGAELYAKYVRSGVEGDRIDEAKLPEHPRLDPEDAKVVAQALMELRPEGLVEEGAFEGKSPPAAMGRMFFTKLRGCSACHSMDAGDGGVSGPTLGNAGDRLHPDFIHAYIKDPQRFDPGVWMSALELSEQDLQRLTGYLVQQKKEEGK